MAPQIPPGAAMDRTQELLNPSWSAALEVTDHGYGDLLGDEEPPTRRFIQRLMRTNLYSGVYQLGRTVIRRFVDSTSPARVDDRARIVSALRLTPGSTVVDIGCGPGLFTSLFGAAVGESGLAIGVDASHQMLRVASTDHARDNVAYLRGDAENLPFTDHSVEAAACLAALYLFNDPFRALDEMARVLRPRGRLVILTSLAPGGHRDDLGSKAVEAFSGCRMFGRDEIVDHLRSRGFLDVDQHTGGLAQTVTATKSAVQ
ncbi:methyltransferase domain-containing protein [Mycobacterium sp. 236(2023)]|uniref:methyltransferase domain-containing protein n=1 Tax=Mycobacterium sp. 236(2023) TaxID=3038163 RepID=UPI00241566F7|nr:methyltransferase domain-containing protein [Mycobacterium sp. 236(2023)]MDG4666360.1 methyltransferase domain-containing protein [Mycobacterium sp. 236(2023)]